MKTTVRVSSGVLALWALLVLAPFLVNEEIRAAAPTLAGSWVTDSMLTARQMQAQLKAAMKTGELDPFEEDEEGNVARAYRNQMARNPRNEAGPSVSGGQNAPAGRNSGTGTFGGGARSGGGGTGGGFGGGGGGGTGGGFGGGGGGARGGRGNNFLPAGRYQNDKRGAKASEKDEGPLPKELSGPAITMELKTSKDKVTGTIVEVSPDDLEDEKLKVEEGTISGNTFKFITYRKTNGIQLPVRWEGEIISDKSVRLTRKNGSGKNMDSVESVIFTRVK